MPIRNRRFALAFAGLISLAGFAQAQPPPPWEQQRHDEMRNREDFREDRIRREEREAQLARQREWRHRHEEEMRAEERERFRHEEGGPDRPGFNR